MLAGVGGAQSSNSFRYTFEVKTTYFAYSINLYEFLSEDTSEVCDYTLRMSC